MAAVLLVVLAVKERERILEPFRAIGWGGLPVEPILGPTWIWILLAETPARMELVGSIIVLGAVVLQTMASVAAERRAAPA